MAKPLTVPTWSTQANYTVNPDPAAIGQPTKLDPSSISVQGWQHMTRPNPRFFNFWQNHVGQWLTWVNTDVISTDGGNYTFNAPLNFLNQGIGIGGGAEFTVAADGFFYLNGPMTVTATGYITIVAGSGGMTTAAPIQVDSGGAVEFASGSDLNFSSGSDINGAARFSTGTWTWNAPQVLNSTVTNTGSGHQVDRVLLGSDADLNFGINDYDEVAVPVIATVARTWGLSTTGATDGCRMRFTAWGNTGGFSADITTAEGVYNMRRSAALVVCLDVVFRAGAWHTSNVTRY